MKKLTILLVPIVVLLMVVLLVARLEAQRAPDWQAEVDAYLAQVRATGESIEIEAVAQAGSPTRFSAAMGNPVRHGWPWTIEAIPFPPTEVWCLLVERVDRTAATAQSAPTRQLLFAGRHSDALWRVGWLVHEGPQAPFSKELVTDLATMECVLDIK